MLKRLTGTIVVVAICAALSGCAARGEVQKLPEEPTASEQSSKSLSANEDAPGASEPLRLGKDQITVLVLNACGVEGAASEAAKDIEALGFEHVTVDNATFYQQGNRVSYHHEEHRTEVEEIAALFDSLPPFDPYCYEDARSGGWSMDYDILVMLGEPGAVYPEPL